MKKIICIIAILILMAGVTGCEDIASQAEYTGFVGVRQECRDNLVAAQEKYVGNSYRFVGVVRQIGPDTVHIDSLEGNGRVYLDLPKGDVMQLTQLQVAEVAGKVKDIDINGQIEMKKSQLISTEITVTGKVESFYWDSKDQFCIEVNYNNSDVLFGVPGLVRTEEAKYRINNIEVEKGDVFTVIGKAKYGNSLFEMYDVTSIVKNQ